MTFTTLNSVGKLVELLPGGADMAVTFANRKQYVRLAEEFRYGEFRVPMAAIRAGMGTIVPMRLLLLWTWEELEFMVCGRPGFDVEALRRHTKYTGYTATSNMGRWILQALESFDDQERERFLRFAWGRSRLPVGEQGWTHSFIVQRKPGDDSQLPHSHTCFFTVEFPQYSSYGVLRQRLHTAITYSGVMSD